MPSIGKSLSLGQVVDVFCTQNDTNGGSSETGTKVLAARPTRTPRTSAAMATTPDGTWPKASRSEDGVSLFVAFTRVHSPLEPKTDSPSRPYLPSIRARQPHPGVHAPCFSRHCGRRPRRSGPPGPRLETSGYRRAPRVRRAATARVSARQVAD